MKSLLGIFKPKNKIMKRFSIYSLVAVLLMSLTSCEAVETVFQAGMWWGIIVVVAVIALIIWLFGRNRGN